MGNVGIKNGETVALVKVSQSLFWKTATTSQKSPACPKFIFRIVDLLKRKRTNILVGKMSTVAFHRIL